MKLVVRRGEVENRIGQSGRGMANLAVGDLPDEVALDEFRVGAEGAFVAFVAAFDRFGAATGVFARHARIDGPAVDQYVVEKLEADMCADRRQVILERVPFGLAR